MNQLRIYLAKTVLSATGLVLLLLLGIETLFTLVNELRQVGTGDYSMLNALSYVVLSLPQQVYQFFPMAALVGTMMGLGLLASRSELIVMRTSGVSVTQISQVIIQVALLLALIAWGFGEGIAPFAERLAQEQKAIALSGGQALRTEHGTWLRDGDDFVHIRAMHIGGHLEGITRYQFNDQLKLKQASYANYADYINKQWVLYEIQETYFDTDPITVVKRTQEKWQSVINPEVLRVVGVKYLDKLSLVGLWRTINYRLSNDLDAKPYQLAFWEKIMQPFSTVVMMLLAVPFIFGPLRSSTMGFRLVIGVLVGFGFHTLNSLFGPITLVYDLPPIWGATLPTLLFLTLGFWMNKRVL